MGGTDSLFSVLEEHLPNLDLLFSVGYAIAIYQRTGTHKDLMVVVGTPWTGPLQPFFLLHIPDVFNFMSTTVSR